MYKERREKMERGESPTCGVFVFRRDGRKRTVRSGWIDGGRGREGVRGGLRGRDQWSEGNERQDG